MQQLPKGLVYEHRVFDTPLSIHILEVDPNTAEIKAAHAQQEILALETTSSIAKRLGAFAAINGGFFRMQGPYAGSFSGLLKIDGKLLSFSSKSRGAIGWAKAGKLALIDRLKVLGELHLQGMTFPIDGINQPLPVNGAILYVWPFHTSTLTPLDTQEMAIDRNLTVSSLDGRGNTTIPYQGYVYSLSPHLTLPFDPEGLKARLKFQIEPLFDKSSKKIWQKLTNIVGGTPVLVHQGKLITDYKPEQTFEEFLTHRHARTAIGIKADGHWMFVVVDGASDHFSVGMTMIELAEFMHSLGCVNALNLDGGGSSTLYLAGEVVNNPLPDSDLPDQVEERLVSNAILIFPKSVETKE